MKKIANIFLALAAIAFVASSCNKEVPYQPGEPDVDGCYGVYFPVQDATGAHTFDPTMPTTVEFTVARTNSDDAIDVPVEVTADAVFIVDPIHFDAGQSETTFAVNFPDAELGVVYPLSVTITDPKYASKYSKGAISFDFSAFRVEWKYFLNPKTNEPATITYSEGWNGHVGTCKIKYYEVNGVRTCITETDPFTDPDGTYYGFWADSDKPETANELNFIWYTEGKCYGPDGETIYQCIQVPEQKVQYHDSYAMDVKYYDYYAYWTILNPQAALVGMDYVTYCSKYSGNYQSSYYDGNGGFYFYCKYYYMIGLGGWGVDDFDPICIADGFVRTDYSIEAETDYTVDGVAPVYFTTGLDVASIKYVAVEGELTATQAGKIVDAIIDGSQEGVEEITDIDYDEDEGEGYAAVGLSFEESGIYTVVAVSLDAEGNAQDNTSVTINYISEADTEANEVIVDVFAEAVPEMYGMDPYTTFAFNIVGQNITDLHYGVFKYNDVASDPDLYFSTVKYSTDYAATAEEIEKVNALGGYYTYKDKLAAATDYVILVWATNGNLDATVLDIYSTPALPYEWVSLGKGIYTEDIATYLYGYNADPNGDGSDYETFDVEVEVFQEKNNPALYMFDPSLAVTAKFFDVTEEVMARYEGGNWRHAEIVLDTTDPASVVWEEQDYGVCLNSGDGFFDGVTNMYKGAPFSKGTFKDGVIAFPTVKGMLCTLGGEGYYYADGSGKTKLVLPSAAKGAPAKVSAKGGDMNRSFTVVNSIPAVSMAKVEIERQAKAVEFEAKSIAPKHVEKASLSNTQPKKAERLAL